MILVIATVVAPLLAAWFCYWVSFFIKPLNNKRGRILCLVLPPVLAAILGIITAVFLGSSGMDIQLSGNTDLYRVEGMRVVEATCLAVAIMLVIVTLLTASAISAVIPIRSTQNSR